MNPWIKLSLARKIAAELQVKYCGQSRWSDGIPIECQITNDLWDHELYVDPMWLNIHWDDFDCVSWIQVGTDLDLVPR